MRGVDAATEFQDLTKEVADDNSHVTDLADDKSHNVFHSEEEAADVQSRGRRSCIRSVCDAMLTLRKGMAIYKSYEVMFAGLALASLYLTVLGFHHITVGR